MMIMMVSVGVWLKLAHFQIYSHLVTIAICIGMYFIQSDLM